MLLTVSHDRAFADKVTDHLFIFEGDGIVKDFQGSLSEYASCLVELENDKVQSQVSVNAFGEAATKVNYKEEKEQRNKLRNFIRQAKKEMTNLERSMEKLKSKAEFIQLAVDDGSDEGWSVLAELTAQLEELNTEIDEKEVRWLELAEELEQVDDCVQ